MNIVIFGFMGVGKTTVGRLLAPRLGYHFIDSDTEAEHEMGMKVSTSFDELGEAEFRAVERRVIGGLAKRNGLVIALGGGAVLDPGNVEALRGTGKMILLTASPEEISQRIRGDSSRPLLAGGDKIGRIRSLMGERLERYLNAADVVVDTNGVPPIRVAEVIRDRLEADSR